MVSKDVYCRFNKLNSLKMFNKVLNSKCFFKAIVASYTNSYGKYLPRFGQGWWKKEKWAS